MTDTHEKPESERAEVAELKAEVAALEVEVTESLLMKDVQA